MPTRPLTFAEHLADLRRRIRSGDYAAATGRLRGYYSRVYLIEQAPPEPSYVVFAGPFDTLAYTVHLTPEAARATFARERDRYIRWLESRVGG
ncbi:hypothetical protein [Sphaerobacter thermophilus]|uniref:Uncharacterized protein n=1 Tax=Sphaerobacter thermophilus (strain ATCC 49802 / DSM 20745 / KCCM 41009 / NCIMB 13125 / S 6022) TaxID=479434 RepID=D1C9F8_SPHTD|nr:hypothetical protein [Sphaerobacter thermophilus]ACZ40451.1 hypothetical protein Sthe_3050 [Sphaerobacter thermophilus DSM 20745]